MFELIQEEAREQLANASVLAAIERGHRLSDEEPRVFVREEVDGSAEVLVEVPCFPYGVVRQIHRLSRALWRDVRLDSGAGRR